MGTFKELIERLEQIGNDIADITVKLSNSENIPSDEEKQQLVEKKEAAQQLLKRKLHRYLSLIRTVMRMVPAAGVRSLQSIGLTKAIDNLMILADPDLLDKKFTLEYVKYLNKLLQINDGSWANEILQVSRLATIISAKKLYGRGNNLLAGSVSAFLNDLTKNHHSKMQKLFVEQYRFDLDVASDYLFGAKVLLKSYTLFKSGGSADHQNEQREGMISKLLKKAREQEAENPSSPESEMPRSLLSPENGFQEEDLNNGTPADEKPSTTLDKIFQESVANPAEHDSLPIITNLAPQPPAKSNGYLEDHESAVLFENFQKEFEQTKKSKVRKLCSYDDSDSDEDMFGRGKDHSSPLSRKIINPAALDTEFELRKRKTSEDMDDVFPSRKRALEMFARKASGDSNGHSSVVSSSENSPPPTQLKLELEFPVGLQKRPYPFDDQDDEEFANGSAPRPFPGKAA